MTKRYPEILSMVRGKYFRGSIHALMLVEKTAQIAGKLPVFI